MVGAALNVLLPSSILVAGPRSIPCTASQCRVSIKLTIYAPMINTDPCIMFWMRAYLLRGQVGGGWALEFESFLGPVIWHQVDRRGPVGAHEGGFRAHTEWGGGAGA
jgi:hypothetical protein